MFEDVAKLGAMQLGIDGHGRKTGMPHGIKRFQIFGAVLGCEGDTIAHAQLTFGRGMVMLGSSGTHGGGFDELVKAPGEVGGVGTQSVYVIVDDADAHLARARAAGAEIVLDIEDKDYGGRGYTCRDLEGHVWSFGTYDPWAGA